MEIKSSKCLDCREHSYDFKCHIIIHLVMRYEILLLELQKLLCCDLRLATFLSFQSHPGPHGFVCLQIVATLILSPLSSLLHCV